MNLRIRMWASRVLLTIGCVSAVGGILWMIWAESLAASGHAFDATRIPGAVTFSGLVVGVVGGAIWLVSE